MNEAPPRIVCFGSAHWDVIGRARPGALPSAPHAGAHGGARGIDAPGSVETRLGGVALNVATGLVAAGAEAVLVSAVGDDAEGRSLRRAVEALGVADGLVTYGGAPTGRYVAIERADGELVAAVADASAVEAMAPDHLDLAAFADADAWFVEANLPPALIRALVAAPGRPPLYADAVSAAKAAKLRPALDRLAAIYCNRAEAEAICATGLNAARAAAEALVIRGALRAVVTDGAQPVADAGPHGVTVLRPETGPIRSATGAGDALIAAHLAATLAGRPPAEALAAGLAAARRQAA